MKRILLRVEYDGTNYCGWQRQINGISVQQKLEEALLESCGEKITVTGSSRTDAGVHAACQMVHFDTQSMIPPEKYSFVLNTHLPPDIRVTDSRQVADAFHARFLTSGKSYTYRIDNSRHGHPNMRINHAHVPVPLDTEIMKRAGETIVGQHDFAAFQASGGTAKTTVRNITGFSIKVCGDEITVEVCGNAFLYNMVRIIAGTLIEIGHEKLPLTAFTDAFSSLDRTVLGPTAPANGLELTQVQYPDEAYEHPEKFLWHDEVN